jgi:hypothetical protein
MNQTDYGLRDAFLEVATIDHWTKPYAVTLTMKQAIKRDRFTIRLDPLKASQNLGHFLNLLNGKIFSSGDLRRGRRVRCIPVLEDGERYHYHLCLDKPAHVPEINFLNLIYDCWARTDFGYWMVEITPADDGWIRYIAKGRSKRVFADALDWENFHNPA